MKDQRNGSKTSNRSCGQQPTRYGIFTGQSPVFFQLMADLAEDADDARRGRG